MENSSFVSDSALNAIINSALDELDDILVQKYGAEYRVSEQAFTTVVGTADYALPATFYKLLGVDLRPDSDWVSLRRWNFKERNSYRNSDAGGTPRYALVGSNLRLYPTPTGVWSGTIFYVPTRTQMTLDADAVNLPNGWEEFAIVTAAIKCLSKEESDVSVLMAEKAELRARIEAAAENRDADEPSRVVDLDRAWIGTDPLEC